MNFLVKIFLTLATIKNLFFYALDYTHLISGEIVYFFWGNRLKIKARTGSADCKEIVVVLSGYEYPLKLLPAMQDPIIFDVGAHIGSFTLFAYNYYKNKNPKFFSFEPDPDNFKYLQYNVSSNNIPLYAYKLYNNALGIVVGASFLDRNKGNDAYHLVTQPQGLYTNCSVTTLLQVVKDEHITKIDILKMDIEGGEFGILNHQESFSIIINKVRFLLMECHSFENMDIQWIKERMKKNFRIIFERNDIIFFESLTTSITSSQFKQPINT